MKYQLNEASWGTNDSVPKESLSVVQQRIKICNECESLTLVKVCKECGCFMPMKVRLIGFEVACPKLKW
jgi:hypothetical protein